MKGKLKRIYVSVVCVVLAFIMSFITACSDAPISKVPVTPGQGTTEPEKPVTPDPGDDGQNPDPDYPEFDSDYFPIGENPEDYVYDLVFSDLENEYDTFTAYIALSDSIEDEIYGICYTDYEQGYTDSDGKVYFSAGFIRFPGEPAVPQSALQDGLEIRSLEEDEEDFSYVYSYSTENFRKHCVIYDKYVQYDVKDSAIEYSEQDYREGMPVDSSRGNLWNYDTESYVYIVDMIDYVPVTGTSLLGEADYQEIVDEVNRILKTQEANLSYVEIESYVSRAMDAVNSYLLGLQEESFLGIPTKNLVEYANQLDPMQHLQIGIDENGNTTVQIIEITKLPTFWEKVLTTIVCSVAVVGGFCCNLLGKALTPILPGANLLFGAIGGALVGAGMEAFSQVVIGNTALSDVSWAQIGVAAVSGAIAGAINVKLKGIGNIFVREVTDTLCDGLIGGTEFFANSLIAGYTFEEACKNFGYGVAAGVILSGGIKVATAAVKGGAKLIRKAFVSMVSDVGGRPVVKLKADAVENSSMRKVSRQGAKDAVEKISNSSEIPKPSKRTTISKKVKNHVLDGGLNEQGKWTGGHSAKILKDDSYLKIKITENSDGTILCKYAKQLPDGTITNIKTSTLFSEEWSDRKILNSIRNVIKNNPPSGYRINNGITDYLYVGTYDNIKIQIIKSGKEILTACPVGGGSLFSGFHPYL